MIITDEEKVRLQRLFDATNKMNEPITGSTVLEWYDRRKAAREKFRLLFNSANLEQLSKDDFVSFLYFENNQSWTGLYRRGTEAAEHINEVKKAIAYLQNESVDIRTRINEVLRGKLAVKGMGKNLATAILHVCDNADKYGVWNNMAEGTLEKLGLLPEMTTNKGETYARINEVLNSIKKELNTDLAHVDCFMYRARELLEGDTTGKNATGQTTEGVAFRLEKELIDFIAKNISVIESGLQFKENEYPTDAGRIDLLGIDRKGNFIVIETKKGRESDKVVGQISRYMGWVKLKMANHSQNVRGIIITNESDEQLSYAVAAHDNIKLKYYRVKFELADHLSN